MNKNLRKLLICLVMVGVIMLSTILSAVAVETTIKVAAVSWPTFGVIKTMIPEFEEKTGIKIEVVEVPFVEFFSKLMTGLLPRAGMYDLITFHTPWLPTLLEGGYLEPFNKFLEDSELADPDYDIDDFIPSPLKWVTADGKLYGLPFDGGVVVLFYRKDLFEERGLTPPVAYIDGELNKEWISEYLELAKKLTLDIDGDGKIDIWGGEFPGKRGPLLVHEYMYRIRSLGGELFDKDWNPIFNSPEGVKAIQSLHDLLWKYKVAPKVVLENASDASVTLFLQGRFAMSTSHNYPLALADNPEMSKIVSKWDIAVRGATTVAAMWYWGMPSDSKNKEAAFKFAQYTTRKENLRLLADNHIPTTRISVMRDPEVLKDNPKFKVIAEAAKRTLMDPALPEWKEIEEILARVLSEVVATEEDVAQQALDSAAQEVRALLKERGYY